ncbi:MAG: DUF3343 domain-containing protein [Syntrophorhabdus sp.]
MPKSKFILVFHSIHDVLRAEKILKENAIVNEIVPIPRNLSSDCGMCIEVDDDITAVYRLIRPIDIAGIYSRETGEDITASVESTI